MPERINSTAKTNNNMTTSINQSAAQAAASYYIRAQYFYYSGTYGAPIDGPLTDGYGQRLEFADRDEAAAHLCEITEFGEGMACTRDEDGRYSFAGTYVCAHGEYSRPRYSIRKVPARGAK